MAFKPLCGICSSDFESSVHSPYNADVLFGKMHERGFEAVQFAFSSVAESGFTPNGQIEIPDIIKSAAVSAVDRSAAKYGIPVKVINGTFNMAHPDRQVRFEGVRRFTLLCEAADALGTKMISLCSGTRNQEHLWSMSDENCSADAWEDMIDTVKRCTELAEKYSITLAVESEASNIISTPERARRLMDTVGSTRLKMILDCANLFHKGEAHTELVRHTIENAFNAYGHDIVIAHGKDIREGDGISFCGTGQGIVDFALTAKLLREYNYSGDMFLHGIFDEDDMIRAREHWLDALKSVIK